MPETPEETRARCWNSWRGPRRGRGRGTACRWRNFSVSFRSSVLPSVVAGHASLVWAARRRRWFARRAAIVADCRGCAVSTVAGGAFVVARRHPPRCASRWPRPVRSKPPRTDNPPPGSPRSNAEIQGEEDRGRPQPQRDIPRIGRRMAGPHGRGPAQTRRSDSPGCPANWSASTSADWPNSQPRYEQADHQRPRRGRGATAAFEAGQNVVKAAIDAETDEAIASWRTHWSRMCCPRWSDLDSLG